MVSFFQRYLLPGFVYQSVIIAGGYATGREIVEFFFEPGPLGGLLGILVAMTIWSITLAACFELARITKSYDYKTYFNQTLGRFSILFEIVYMLQIVLVISIVGAAAGEPDFEVGNRVQPGYFRNHRNSHHAGLRARQ